MRKNGDMFTLRWQHPPNKKLITRHRINLALLCPNDKAERAAELNKEQSRKAEPSKAAAPKETEAAHPYPADWTAIDVGSLVLAKDDARFRPGGKAR